MYGKVFKALSDIRYMMKMKQTTKMPKYCSMKGMLSFRILCYLRKSERSGQEIAELIAKSHGRKPSPGTIYPALKELNHLGLIKRRQKGKEVFYSLTGKGKDEADIAWKYFKVCFADILKD